MSQVEVSADMTAHLPDSEGVRYLSVPYDFDATAFETEEEAIGALVAYKKSEHAFVVAVVVGISAWSDQSQSFYVIEVDDPRNTKRHHEVVDAVQQQAITPDMVEEMDGLAIVSDDEYFRPDPSATEHWTEYQPKSHHWNGWEN